MKGEKNEGKQMVPLFPGFGINAGDKMTLFEGYNVSAECSRSMLMVPPSIVCSTFASQASSSNVSGAKRKQRSTLEFSVPSFLQSGKALNHRNLHSVCLKQAKSEDRTVEILGEENSKLSPSNDLIKKQSDDHDYVASKVKKEETSDIFMEGLVPGLDLANDEVVRVIGQRLFLKARKIMVHQQKVFSLQMFELHRLITVQRLMARSPEILHKNTFHPNKPSIKFPPMNKLLYVSPLDTSLPSLPKPKADAPTPDAITDCGAEAVHGLIPLPKTNMEKGPLTPKTTNPPPIPIDPKVAPWCPPPIPSACNQWLIPIRSPSEGLVYKPYPGPCFPAVGFLGPGYRPMSGPSGGLYGPELTQSYIQHYPMPVTGSNHETKPMIGVQDDGPERVEKDGLALFPTMPSIMRDQRNEQKVEVIKVVPHDRDSAPASASRILRSIQEERRKHGV